MSDRLDPLLGLRGDPGDHRPDAHESDDDSPLAHLLALDPGHNIVGPNKTGTVEQQINRAVTEFSISCEFTYGYIPSDDELTRTYVLGRLRGRGIIE